MAKVAGAKGTKRNETLSKKTSIGHSANSRPSSKNQRRSWKKYRGQG